MKTEEAFSESGLDWAAFLKALYLLGVVLFVATPLVATVLGGFKSLGELRTNPFGAMLKKIGKLFLQSFGRKEPQIV